MILQGFPGFLFFRGYKMATSADFFVAIISCGDYIKLIGYFALLVRVQVAVGVHGGLNPFMPQAFCNQKRRAAHIYQQTGVSMTKLVEATNGHSLVEAENAICYDIVRGYGLRRSLFWRRGVFFHGTKKQKTSVYRNV